MSDAKRSTSRVGQLLADLLEQAANLGSLATITLGWTRDEERFEIRVTADPRGGFYLERISQEKKEEEGPAPRPLTVEEIEHAIHSLMSQPRS